MIPCKLSPSTIKALAEAISGGSNNDTKPPIGIYRSGYQLQEFMAECNLDFRMAGGSRVPTLLEFLRNLALGPGVDEKMARVIERVAEPFDYRDEPEKLQAVLTYLNEWLARDSLELCLIDTRP